MHVLSVARQWRHEGYVAPGANVRLAAPACRVPADYYGVLGALQRAWDGVPVEVHFKRHRTPLVDGYREL